MRTITLLLLLTSCLLQSEDLPDDFTPADGDFDRFEIIVPEGWHYKEAMDKPNVAACYVSKENIDQDGSFATGVTIFVFDDVNNSLGVNGSAYILAQAADAFTLSARTFTRFNSQLRDHGVAANYEYIDRSVPEAVIRCFVALIEDVKKKQVITVICEAPVEDFAAMMVTLRPMLSRIDVE